MTGLEATGCPQFYVCIENVYSNGHVNIGGRNPDPGYKPSHLYTLPESNMNSLNEIFLLEMNRLRGRFFAQTRQITIPANLTPAIRFRPVASIGLHFIHVLPYVRECILRLH